ncbi:MAG: response regulator [Candidatus Brocadiia bacterium]
MAKAPHILVVDGEPRICELLEALFTRFGCQAASARHAAEALARVEAGAYDLALVDLSTPGADGFTLVARLKAVRPDLPVIVVAGGASLETAVAVLLNGADDYVTKPFDMDELRKVVSRSLQPVPVVP